MKKQKNRILRKSPDRGIHIPIILVILAFFCAPQISGAIDISGTFTTIGQGFQDYAGEDHFNVAPGLKFKASEFGVEGVSLHGYIQYFGDAQNAYFEEGKDRLYHGYLLYDKKKCPLRVRAGRFFLFRGVAVGVLDGGEATYRLNKSWQVTAFGGQMGPLSREFDVDRQGDSPMFGGEIRWRPKSILGMRSTLALSYTRQERDEELMRHMAGLSFNLRINRNWTSLNVIQMNIAAGTLRKAITRWRYSGSKIQFSAEAGVVTPYAAAYSYFNDFESEGSIFRLRNTIEYHFTPRKWGVGLSTLFYTTSEYGLKTGPYLIFPYGRIGYHFSSGDQPNNNVFWGQIKYSPKSCLDLYAYAAAMEYEWEAMDIGTQETTMMNVGFNFRPDFLKRIELGFEWQNYSTPQLKSDRRIITILRWNFDYKGGK